MKVHTNNFKNEIKLYGKQLDSKIIYPSLSGTVELGVNELNSITPHYEGGILKSVMRGLTIDSNVEIPKGTMLNCQFGVLVNGTFEYINFGNYIVDTVEKQEDTNSYLIECCDSMLYAMKDYEAPNITYPITVRSYINAICNKIGLTFKNANDTFANYDKQIPNELYSNIGYTYRNVLDELAQVTASTICINEVDDELEIRYINDTNDTIDEEFLKDVNVNFGEKYGPVNSIVLTRAGGSDSVYLKDQESIDENGLCELKIEDNQIMNLNDRADYLPDILEVLDGFEYYTNDFSSTGICYYDVCDRYNVQVGENTYSCVMFNDEVDITQGLEEFIHTDMPEESETEYKYASKDDRQRNQTYLIVDKQNQIIESIVNNVTEQNEKISQVTQTVDEINSKISDIADITISGESNYATFTLDNINQSEPIMVKVKPISENISYLYPNMNLFPSSNTFLKTRKIRFENLTTNEITDYTLPDDLLYYDSETYDEFYLDYDSQTCQVTKRCKYNADGTVSPLEQEQTTSYTYPTIELQDGNYRLSLIGYEYGYLFVRLMASNIYTSQFATKSEVSSQISQKANEINLSVDQKLSNYSTTTQMNSAIVLKANEITSTVSQTYETKSNAQTQYSQIQQTTNSISTTVANNNTKANIIAKINDNTSQAKINADAVDIDANDVLNILAGNTINMTAKNIAFNSTNFNVDENGNMICKNAIVNNAEIKSGILKLFEGTQNIPKFSVTNQDYTTFDNLDGVAITPTRIWMKNGSSTCFWITKTNTGGASLQMPNDSIIDLYNTLGTNTISIDGGNGHIICDTLIQTSKEEYKKNFKKLENALDIIKNIDIYKYNMKTDKDIDKKHIGFVIGDKYNYSEEVTSKNNDGVDIYALASVCCKAIQEQQEQIDLLKSEIKLLKERIDK